MSVRTLKFVGVGVSLAIIVGVILLWRLGRQPQRPNNMSPNALYMETGVVPFKLRPIPGHWIDCWFDDVEKVDRCKLTDEKGNVKYEDVFLPLQGGPAIPEESLRFRRTTGSEWVLTRDERVSLPVIYLANGQILLPRGSFEHAKRFVLHQ
jgi:hypothetical protein